MMAVLKHLSKIKQAVLHAFVGQACPSCYAPVASDNVALCVDCYHALVRWDRALTPVPALPKHVDAFYAPFLYEAPLTRAIHMFKYADQRKLTHLFVPFLVQEHKKIETPSDVLIPVPMHRGRLWRRQYNQSALLADGLSDVSGVPYGDYIARTKATPHQRGLSAKKRKKNLKGAFCVVGDVKNKHCVLIDDVWTTGSTIEECARVLKKAGAKKVTALTLCYVEP